MATPSTPCPYPKFFTAQQWQTALENSVYDNLMDHAPVVKLFQPDGAYTWLICSVDPENPHLAFSLCDLWLGFPELDYVDLSELAELRGTFGLPIERDIHTDLDQPLRHYVSEAIQHGQILT